MPLPPWIVEEHNRRDREARRGPLPLYAPSPWAPGHRREREDTEREDDQRSGDTVIIIDMNDLEIEST